MLKIKFSMERKNSQLKNSQRGIELLKVFAGQGF
jgi:hypothetical protein